MGKRKVKKITKKPSSKTTKKRVYLIIPVIIVICIIGVVFFTLIPEEAKAQLIVESGTVQVKHEGESWTTAQNGTLLYQSDSVKTGDDSSASIVLFKSSIIRLDSNTIVTLKEIIQQEETSVTIEQEVGRTWSTIEKISGIDNYDVQTPTTVASVRGTSFDVNVSENGTTVVSVIKGMVNLTITENGTKYTIELRENWSMIVGFDSAGQPQPFEPDDWITNNLLEEETFKEQLKEDLYSRIEPYIPQLKADYGMTDEEIDVLIDGFIRGEFSLPPNLPDQLKDILGL